MKHWEAPRLAYELAADWAGRWQEATAGQPDGVLGSVPGAEAPAIGKKWHDLAGADQRDVLDVLGVQLRSAIYEIRRQKGMGPNDQVAFDFGWYLGQVCDLARQVIPELTKPVGPRTWELPSCPHCAALVACSLIHAHVTLIAMTGVPDPAVVLRQITESLRVPAQEQPE